MRVYRATRWTVVLGTVFLFSHPAHANLILDQSHTITDPIVDAVVVTQQSLAQTFTVGVAGTLAKVDLQAYAIASATDSVVLEIRNTVGASHTPTTFNAQSLYARTLSPSDFQTLPGFPNEVPMMSFDVSDAQIEVEPGDVLAISLRGGGDFTVSVLWRWGTPAYEFGTSFNRASDTSSWSPFADADHGFQTWVTPEPSSLVLLGIGMFLMRRPNSSRQ